MDASFPLNDLRATPYRDDVDDRPLTMPGTGHWSETVGTWPARNDRAWDDFDDECFLAAILEMEREQAGRPHGHRILAWGILRIGLPAGGWAETDPRDSIPEAPRLVRRSAIQRGFRRP